jgi:TetR/AcrR family transcriptional regulator, acrAB operon repressor
MRRTKEEAALTRASIVDAGLSCFDRHGIGGSTIEQIAAHARLTKGAVYHHFRNKREILHELREQVSLPLLDEADMGLLRAGALPALERVERFLASVVETLESDRRIRRALAVMQFKCEYVGDLARELEGAIRNNDRLIEAFRGAYREARRRGELARGLSPDIAALETLMFMSGMVRQCLLQKSSHPLRKRARAVIRAHVASRRA